MLLFLRYVNRPVIYLAYLLVGAYVFLSYMVWYMAYIGWYASHKERAVGISLAHTHKQTSHTFCVFLRTSH